MEHCVYCPGGGGKKEHVNKSTVLQAASSVNVTLLNLDEPICIVVQSELPAQPDSHVGTEAVELVSIEFSGGNIGVEPTKSDVSLCFKGTNRIL